MMRGLVEKELRQHGITLAFLGLLLLGGLATIGGHGFLMRAKGGGFAAVQLMHYTFVPLACLVLGQALIATEFRQKTQLFLEGLPLPRWKMLAVKFAMGLLAMMGAIALALGFAWWRARHAESMTPRFVLLLWLKSLGWVWFFYTLFFMHAFLGRYRVIVAITLLTGLIFASKAGIAISAFGPFALVDDRFAFERMVIPGRALVTTALLGTALATLGFLLGLVRDATVAAMLAEKMSLREKVVMTMLSLGAMMGIGYVYERRLATEPVRMPGAVEIQKGVVRVSASAAVDAPSREETAAITASAQHIAEELGALADYLQCTRFPPVFVVHRRDLGAGEFTNGELKSGQGVLVRANLTAREFQASALDAWLLRETLLAQSGTLAGRERNAWVLDGFLQWWPPSQHGREPAVDETTRAAARETMAGDFSPKMLRSWYSFRAKAGEEKARKLAGSGLAVIAQRRGGESLRTFLSTMLGTSKPVDLRGWCLDMWRSAPANLEKATSWNEEELVREWRAALAEGAAPVP